MSVQIIRNALCIVVRNEGEYGSFFVREGKSEEGPYTRYYCELTIQSSFGNVGYFWSHMGSPACSFLSQTNADYVLGKLWGGKSTVFDAQATIVRLKQDLFKEHRQQWNENAREIYDALEQINLHHDTAEQMYNDMCEDLEFDANRSALIDWLGDPCEIPWQNVTNPQARGFWEKLWPEFIQALNDEALRPRDIVP